MYVYVLQVKCSGINSYNDNNNYNGYNNYHPNNVYNSNNNDYNNNIVSIFSIV